MIKLKIAIVCFFISVAVFGQQRSWFVPIHSSDQLEIQRLKTDIVGNVYFSGGSGNTTFVGDSAFINNYVGGPKTMLKFDSLGQLKEILRLRTDTLIPFVSYFYDMEIDNYQNLYFMNNSYNQTNIFLNDSIIYSFADSFLYYYPGGNMQLPKSPPRSFFILKYDSLNNLKNTIVSNISEGGSVEFVLFENYIYAISSVRYKAIFGMDTIIFPDFKIRDVWVKYNLNGDLLDYFISDRVYYSNGYDEGVIADPDGNILFIAKPLDNYNFMNVSLKYNSYCIVNFTPFSKVNWTFEAPFAEYIFSQIIDNQGNVYVCGEANNDFAFNNQLIEKGYFIFKLDKDGQEVWAKSFDNNHVTNIFYNGSNQIYMLGVVNDFFDFGVTQLSSVGDGTGFLAKMNELGQFEWVTTIMDTSPYWFGWQLVAFQNNLYVAGKYKDTVKFNGLNYSQRFQGWTGFISKFIDQTYISDIYQATLSENEFTIFPNPTDKHFTIKIHSEFPEKFNIYISDITGKKVSEIYSGQIIKDFEMSANINLLPGIYLVTSQSNNWTMTKKIVIK